MKVKIGVGFVCLNAVDVQICTKARFRELNCPKFVCKLWVSLNVQSSPTSFNLDRNKKVNRTKAKLKVFQQVAK